MDKTYTDLLEQNGRLALLVSDLTDRLEATQKKLATTERMVPKADTSDTAWPDMITDAYDRASHGRAREIKRLMYAAITKRLADLDPTDEQGVKQLALDILDGDNGRVVNADGVVNV